MKLVRRIAVLFLLLICLVSFGGSARAEWNECQELAHWRYYECLDSCEMYPSYSIAYRYCRSQCTNAYYDELEVCNNP